MQPFIDLGVVIESRWRDKNYDENVLPCIAANELAEADLPNRTDPWDIVRWVHTTTNLPHQVDLPGKFGNPPITIFTGPRFHIDVYYWLDGTTSIHQHAFSGAFQVLLGSSVHSKYEFKEKREINPHLLIGDVLLKHVSLLEKSDIEEIQSGSRLIHSLFHLDRPSATIVIRSNHAPGAAVQFQYLKPSIAIDPFFEDPWMTRRVQTVSLLLATEHPKSDKMIYDLLDIADFHTTFAVLETVFRFLGRNDLEELFNVSKTGDRFQAILNRARLRHGELVDVLPAVFNEKQRQRDIVKRRGMVERADHRFLLALLLNVPKRMRVLDLVKQRFPEKEPVELVIDWVRELGKIKIFGSPEPNVLGINAIDDAYLEVLAGLLRGLSAREIKTLRDNESAQRSTDEMITDIKASPLFKAILTEEPTTPLNMKSNKR
jgi:hypothetical protein